MTKDNFTHKVIESAKISSNEMKAILNSLNCHGFVIIKNFINNSDLKNLIMKADESLKENYNAGFSNFSVLKSIKTNWTMEFHHPFYISKVATSIVTNKDFCNLIKTFLGKPPRIHSALFQKSFPTNELVLDWHIDLGSNKTLNPKKKYADKRLRMIVYLTDVNEGGLNYMSGSQKSSVESFIELPYGQLFPKSKIPKDKKKVHVKGIKGDIILFNTHGLHKPGLLKEERVVLNVWFCRNDFKGKLPPQVLDVGNLDKGNYDLFSTTSNFSGMIDKLEKKSFLRKIKNKFDEFVKSFF